MRLVLASGSRWRLKMLRDAGLPAIAVPAGIDERATTDEDPVRLVRTLARRKAEEVFASHPRDLVLGADQMLHDADGVFGKPSDPVEHLTRLQAMRGRSHELVTAFCLRGPGVDVVEHETTTLHVRDDLQDAELAAYVDAGEGASCAGGYTIEGHGSFLFERVEGDWFNVVGLPLLRVQHVLRELGWRYPWDDPQGRGAGG